MPAAVSVAPVAMVAAQISGAARYAGPRLVGSAYSFPLSPTDHRKRGNGCHPGGSCHRVLDAARGPGLLVRRGGKDGTGQRGDGHGEPEAQECDAWQDIHDV